MERIITMGSVVQLKTNENYMIIGHLPKSTYDNKQYDFVGCKYPAGLIGGLKMFNSEDIKKVEFNGYSNPTIMEVLAQARKEEE